MSLAVNQRRDSQVGKVGMVLYPAFRGEYVF